MARRNFYISMIRAEEREKARKAKELKKEPVPEVQVSSEETVNKKDLTITGELEIQGEVDKEKVSEVVSETKVEKKVEASKKVAAKTIKGTAAKTKKSTKSVSKKKIKKG